MRKRILGLASTLSVLCAVIPINTAQASGISIGGYLQMGMYYGEPILWRCVDIDENGPLMLSDKIICIKPFDAQGEFDSSGSHSRNSVRKTSGSNYWADSNMRSWLNSSADEENVDWLCGNPPEEDKVTYNAYDKESGFLTNFSRGELDAIKEVTYKSLVAYPEYDNGIYTTGTEAHKGRHQWGLDISINDAVANYDAAYAEYVTDKVFLPDVKQMSAVYGNRGILGEDYHIGEPTEQCVANSEYKNEGSLEAGQKWYYWLRSPESSYTGFMYYIGNSGNVKNYYAYVGDVGVRPAFYLSDNASLSGSGTESDPYTVGGNAADKETYDYTVNSVTQDIPSSGKFRAEVSVTKNTDVDGGVIILALYSKEGALADYIFIESDFEQGKTYNAGGILTAFEDARLKAFVWDSLDGMKPISNVKE